MNRAIAAGCVIAGTFFGIVLIGHGFDWPTVLVAFLGVIVGMIAFFPLAEWYVRDSRHREGVTAAESWIRSDPHEFSRAMADLYADELETARGDKLADAMYGASNLAAALNELVRRGAIRRQEELLRSRTWLP